jgi:hypothetical protein
MAEVYRNLVIVVILVMAGADRAMTRHLKCLTDLAFMVL